jgi:hypothetical protein
MVKAIGSTMKEHTMTWLLYNIPLMVLFFAVMVGIPLWLVAKRPDTSPEAAQTPAVACLPANRYEDLGWRRAA